MKIGISAIHVRPQKSGSHEPYLTNLIDALSQVKTTHEFTLFVTQDNQHLFLCARDKMDVVVYPRVAANVLPRIFFEQFVIPLDVWFKKIDVMHYPGTTGSIFKRKRDVVTIHHDSITQRASMSAVQSYYYDFLLKSNKRVGVIIAPTRVYADQLIRLFDYQPDQVCAIHHGVNPIFRSTSSESIQEAKERYHIENDAILTVTNTRPHKNIANLLKAYNILLTQYNFENQLVMVGYVEKEILDKHIREISSNPEKMSSRIRIIPFLPHEQLPPIYSAASLFVFVSSVETFGMPLSEAMACGLPIIASDIPVHREIVGNGGELVAPADPALLASKIYRAMTDSAYRREMKARSLRRSQQFSWEQTALQTIQAYENAYSAHRDNHSMDVK